MKNYYRFHNYIDSYSQLISGNNEIIEHKDLCLGFTQVIPKLFDVPNLSFDDNKDCYYLSFYTTFQFIVHNNKLIFQKFRFSISGTESKLLDHKDFLKLPSTEKFNDFIKKEYVKFVNQKIDISSNNEQYSISDSDHTIIKNGIKHLHSIFPDDKNIVIIKEPSADFYMQNIEDGISLYKQSRAFLDFKNLSEKLPVKNNKPVKQKKI